MEKQRKLFLATGLGITGNVAGILVAVKRKSGFWGGVGWFIVGGLAGAALGYIAYSLIPDSGPTAEQQAAETNAAINTAATQQQSAFEKAFAPGSFKI